MGSIRGEAKIVFSGAEFGNTVFEAREGLE